MADQKIGEEVIACSFQSYLVIVIIASSGVSDVEIDLTVFLPTVIKDNKLKGKHRSSRCLGNISGVHDERLVYGCIWIELNLISVWVSLL